MAGLLKNLLKKKPLADRLVFAEEDLGQLVLTAGGGPGYRGRLRTVIDLEQSQEGFEAVPVLSEIRPVDEGPFMYAVFSVIGDALKERFGQLRQENPAQCDPVRWVAFDLDSTSPSGPIRQRWSTGDQPSSHTGVRMLADLRRGLDVDMELACLAFRRTGGGYKLVNGYEIRADHSCREFPGNQGAGPLEMVVQQHAGSRQEQSLVVHLMGTSTSRRFAGFIRRLGAKGLPSGPLTWDRQALNSALQAMRAMGRASHSLQEQVDKQGLQIDMEAGNLLVDAKALKVDLIGSFRQLDWSWLWAWDRGPGQAPEALLGLRARLGNHLAAGFQAPSAGTSLIHLDFFESRLLACAAAHAAGYTRMVSGVDPSGVDVFYAVDEA